MAKKMSVAEMLAAARAEKSGGTPPAEAPAAETPASSPPEATAPAESAAGSAPATSKPAAGKPASAMSVAEILAAARAKKGAGETAPAVAKAAPAQAAAKAPAATQSPKPAKTNGETTAAAPTGPKDTASILAAARKGAKPGPMTKAEAAAQGKLEPAAKKKIEVPPMPAKPAYAKPQAAAVEAQSRRSFLAATTGFLIGSPLAIGFTTLAITHLMWLLGLARFMFPNVLIEPPTRFKVGFPDSLAPGQVETKYIPQFGVWIVKNEYEGQPMIYALKAVCTHLGCTPNWLEAEQKFKCPCHGSGFYKDGINFEGPAPRPLERYAISIADDGQLQVDKSRTFNQELGQWTDAASFVSV